MKNILKIAGMLLVGISMLNAAECSSEKKAQMIMNGIEQSVIDEMCSSKSNDSAKPPINIIINNSSSSDNTNTNTNNVDVASAYGDFSKTDSMKRDRMYIALSVGSGSGQYEYENYSSIYTDDISGQITSLSLGYVFDSNNRFEIASSVMTIDDHDYLTVDGVDLNWIWTMGTKEVQAWNMRPYLLFGFGAYTVANTNRGNSFDAVGVNLGLGVMYPLGETFEVDLGYHVKSVSWDITDEYDNVVATEALALSALNLSFRMKF